MFNNFLLKIVELDRPQMTIWHMRIACWVLKTTNTHSGYVILLSFPWQQWLHKRTSTLHCSTLFVLFNLTLSNSHEVYVLLYMCILEF